MLGIVALVVFVGLVVAAVAFVRSRPKPMLVRTRPVSRTAPPSPAGLAEFVALVERETGRHLDLPPAAPEAIARTAPHAPQRPPAERKHKPKATPHKRRPPSVPPIMSPLQPVVPPARPPLAAFAAVPPLRRRPALAALAPLDPLAPLAPRAARSS